MTGPPGGAWPFISEVRERRLLHLGFLWGACSSSSLGVKCLTADAIAPADAGRLPPNVRFGEPAGVPWRREPPVPELLGSCIHRAARHMAEVTTDCESEPGREQNTMTTKPGYSSGTGPGSHVYNL